MINVGFIGCGRIADLHYLGYRENTEARLYAVCDLDDTRREERQRQWGVQKAYKNYHDLLADPKVDAVEVLTFYDTHEPVVRDAVSAGKHVACQKPMTTDLPSADRMLAAAKTSGKVFKVTEIYVTYPPIVLAKRLMDEGAIGEPLGMRINYISSPKGGWEVSAQTYEQQVRIAGRGLGLETFDHGHHEWATAWRLLGEAERVSAWVDTLNGVVDGPATVMWKCRGNKRYGVCDFMFAPELHIPSKYYSNDEIYQIIGSKGVIMINRGTGEMMDRPPVSLFDGDKWTHFNDVASDWAEGFIGSARNFIAAIQGREPPLLTGDEGREVLRFGLAVAHSAGKRREVYLDELDHPFPAWYSWRRRRRERGDCIVGPRRRSWSLFADRTGKYAPLARNLTLKMPERFDSAAAGEWECSIALELLAEHGVATERFTLAVQDGKLTVTPDEWPEHPDLTLHLRAGVWAALLLGRKRIETAIFQGLIKYEGKVEQALPLRNAFHL
jgi:predicted dehydrogenase